MSLRCVHLIAFEEGVVIRYVQAVYIAPFAALHEDILLQLYQVQLESISLSLFEFNLARDAFEFNLFAFDVKDKRREEYFGWASSSALSNMNNAAFSLNIETIFFFRFSFCFCCCAEHWKLQCLTLFMLLCAFEANFSDFSQASRFGVVMTN